MNKLITSLVGIGLLSSTSFVWAQNDPPAASLELRPTQIAMQARAGWMKSMNDNLSAMNYAAVGKDATALSAQTSAAAEKLPNPLARDLTTKVSTLAGAVAEAAGKKDSAAITANLAEIKATCGECHTRIRDKK